MRSRALIPLAIAMSACSVAPGVRAASQSPTPAVVSACANPALPAIIAMDPETTSTRAASPSPRLGLAKLVAPKARLDLAVAKDEQSRELGLMCVLRLQPQTGMIFVFPGPERRQEFWMKNTLIPLDMVWVRANGMVDTVAADVPKSTRSTPDARIARRAGTGTYVIELAAGEAAADGIVRGVHLDFQAPLTTNS